MSHNPIIAITTIDGFDVYPETGKVISHHQKTTNSKPGEEIGKQKGNGYRKIRINGKTVNLHRYIYETVHNVKLSPDQFINHINMDKTDNRIDNLEIVTRRQTISGKKKVSLTQPVTKAFIYRNPRVYGELVSHWMAFNMSLVTDLLPRKRLIRHTVQKLRSSTRLKVVNFSCNNISRAIGNYAVEKLVAQINEGTVKAALVLQPLDVRSKFTRVLVEAGALICMLKERVYFELSEYDRNRTGRQTPHRTMTTFAFYYLEHNGRTKEADFVRIFGELGFIPGVSMATVSVQ